jgi:murein DD-endopeptidase MepM/ murein hydrolase activator NlpD
MLAGVLSIGAVVAVASRLPDPATEAGGLELARRAPIAETFGFPVGARGSADGYYDAQPFGDNHHLGSDWNGVGGGNSDLGDPVLAIADGVVMSARDLQRGWGRVIRVAHNVGTRSRPHWVESIYAHLDAIAVKPGAVVRRGARIGAIGTAHGKYWAHLHLEIRDRLGLPLGRGYSERTAGYVDPTAFIRARRSRARAHEPQTRL